MQKTNHPPRAATSDDVAEIKVSKKALLGSLVILIFAVPFFAAGGRLFNMIGLVLMVLSLIDAASVGTLALTTRCSVRERRLNVRYGLLRHVVASIPLSDIRHVGVLQTWLGSLLGYGSLVILAKNSGVRVQYVRDPFHWENVIRTAVVASSPAINLGDSPE